MSQGPTLRSDLVLVAQVYRDEQTYIVKDPTTHKYFRFKPLEVLVMQALDGRPVEEAAADLRESGVPVSAAALDGFARKLGGMGLLERTLGERSVLALERLRAERHRRRRRPLFGGELLRMRWSLGDPNAFLDVWVPRLGFLFTRGFIAVSVALFAAYFLVLGLRWHEFTQALHEANPFGAGGLGAVVIFWTTGLTIIAIHEFGHAFSCKYFGGEVHEMGAMLIYFEPAFYCNVNDAWTFPELRARLWVTAAGSWIQFVLAGIAALVWAVLQPGTLASRFAVAAILFGGVTAIATNFNPLMPLDGYFALSDWLEIPNLRQRAFGHLRWWLQTTVLRLEIPEPPADDRERRIFLVYGALASLYFVTVMLFIAGIVLGWADRVLGGLGLLLGIGGIVWMLRARARAALGALALAARAHRTVWRGRLDRQRWRLAAGVVALLLLGLLLPWRITVAGPFVLAPVVDAPVIAGDSGVVAAVHVREGMRVAPGMPLVELRSFTLERAVADGARALDSLARAVQAASVEDAAERRRLEIDRDAAAARLAALQERRRHLTLRAPVGGVIVTPRPEELLGRWLPVGDTVLRLGQPGALEARIALAGAGAALARPGQSARLVSYLDVGAPVRATVTSVAAATDTAALEARVRVPAGIDWRPGATGEASIRLQRASALGALWWGVRKRLRTDLLL